MKLVVFILMYLAGPNEVNSSVYLCILALNASRSTFHFLSTALAVLASCVICSGFYSSRETDRTKEPKQSEAAAVYSTATTADRQHFYCCTV